MKSYTPLFTLFFTIICGCDRSHYISEHGDVGQFVLQNAERFGGTPIATNGLPHIDCQWSHFENRDGLDIVLPTQMFGPLVAFLHKSFGNWTGFGGQGEFYEYLLSTNGATLYLERLEKVTELHIGWHPDPTLSARPSNISIAYSTISSDGTAAPFRVRFELRRWPKFIGGSSTGRL